MARALALHLLALLLYPGLVLTLVVGAAAEAGAARALAGGGLRAALLTQAVRLRQAARRPVDLAVPLLVMLAAAQLAAPLNPVSPVERNLVVAAIALAAVTSLVGATRRTLLVQVCWIIALFAPALPAESLRPQALGSVVVPSALPLKVTAGLLALLCLPALLPLRPGAADDALAVRPLLWLPLCGLFVSLFLPPGAEDLGGVLRFLVSTLAAAAAAIGLAVGAERSRLLGRAYPRLLVPLALGVIAVAAVTSVLT